jgi:hypothetical protein
MAKLCYDVVFIDTGEFVRRRFPAFSEWNAIRNDVDVIRSAYPERPIRLSVYRGGELVNETTYPREGTATSAASS